MLNISTNINKMWQSRGCKEKIIPRQRMAEQNSRSLQRRELLKTNPGRPVKPNRTFNYEKYTILLNKII